MCQQGPTPSEVAGKDLLQAALPASGSTWACGSVMRLHVIFSPCVSACVLASPFHKDTSHNGLGTYTTTPVPPDLNSSLHPQ